jgi:DNA-binding SARP family transcriptional activator
MPASLQNLVVQQFEAVEPKVRLVVLQPNYAAQHALLTTLIQQPNSVYVRVDGNGLTAADVRAQIEAAATLQTGSSDLSKVDTLILDEFDRVLSVDADMLLPWLTLDAVAGRVIVLGRRVPYIALDDPRLRDCTRFIPAEHDLMLWDYTHHDGETALLEVRALGAGRVHLNGRPVDNWDGVLPRSLFFYLIDRGMTTRGEIFDTFWPNLSTREATNVFHVTKRKISEVLGMDLTVYWSGFYHIAPKVELSYDAALFSSTVQDSAVVSNDEAVVLLRRALSLYRGDFLSSIDMPWVQKRRQELRQTYGEALVALAKSTERQGEVRRALGLYLRAATTNRQREDLALSIMRLYHDLNMDGDALRVYSQLESQLKAELGVSPAPQLQELAATIRAAAEGRAAS